jgi:hypothetical protein
MRVPFYLVDSSGNPVTGLSFSGAEIQISKNGSSNVNGSGASAPIGAGAYYYELGAGEDNTPGALLVKVNKAGSRPVVATITIPVVGSDLILDQADDTLRRIPAFLVNSSGAVVTGATPSGAQLQVSKNGAAWVDAGGTWDEIGGGEYYYTATAGEVDTAGFLALKVAATGAIVYVYSATIAEAVDTTGNGGGGYFGGYFGGDASPLQAPTISNITPVRATPGAPGAFSTNYSVARATPIEWDLTNIVPGAGITITVKLGNRDETYTALGHDGEWLWPFDVDSSIGDLSSEPVHVSLLPRDGWPPVPVDIKCAAVAPAVEP